MKRKISLVRLFVVSATIAFIIFDLASPDPNRIGTIASILVAAGTVFLAVETWNSVHEAAVRYEKENHIKVRPQLAPMSIPYNLTDSGGRSLNIDMLIDDRTHALDIDIQNVGAGVAENIWGLLLPYAELANTRPTQFSMRYPVPLPAGALKTMSFQSGGTVFDNHDGVNPNVSFSVPKELATVVPDMLIRRDRIVARLTLTCRDVFDHKHASIYELTMPGEWVGVTELNDIDKDIRDLDTDKGTKMKRGGG